MFQVAQNEMTATNINAQRIKKKYVKKKKKKEKYHIPH